MFNHPLNTTAMLKKLAPIILGIVIVAAIITITYFTCFDCLNYKR